jgi:hypothetical protein
MYSVQQDTLASGSAGVAALAVQLYTIRIHAQAQQQLVHP